MKKKFFATSLIVAFIAGVFAVISCSKNEDTQSNGKSIEQSYNSSKKPIDGFYCISENEKTGKTMVYSGTSPDVFINTKRYRDSKLVDETDILYTFEDDIDTIRVSNQTSKGFDMTVSGETYHLYGFKNIKGGIKYSIESPKGDVVSSTLYHDSIDVESLLKNMAEIDLFWNPFIDQNANTKKVWPVLKAIGKIAAKIAVPLMIIDIYVTIKENNCDRELETAKHNCSQGPKKCIKQVEKCKWECVKCPEN